MSNFGKPWSIQDLEKHLEKNPESRVISKKAVGIPVTGNPATEVSLTKDVNLNSNKKSVRNAQKSVDATGRKFDSKLERYFAEELDKHGITYEFQKVFLLQEKFRFHGELIRPITVKIDFWFPQFNLLADTKGWQTNDSKLRYKMLKFQLWVTGDIAPDIELPGNRKKCDELVLRLLARKNES